MKFGLITIGSQGDVEPFIALGNKLRSRGHQVRITTFRKFEQYIVSEGFEYSPLAGDAVEVIRLLIGEHVSSFEYFRNLEKLLDPVKKEFLSDIEYACTGVDVVLYSLLGSVAWHVLEKKNIPCFRVSFCPIDPTGEFPAMSAPDLPLGSLYNRFTFACGDLLWANFTRRMLNSWRKEMGLKEIQALRFPYRSMHGRPLPTLYAYSTLVAPKPREWDENKYVTGYWIRGIKDNWKPDKELTNFLNEGPKPVYIGFGSAVGGSFEQAFDIVMQSLKLTKVRAVLSSGWGNLKGYNLPDSVLQIGNVPHEWLFRNVSAVIHHGGAGTTAAGLRAGVPTIIVPFGGDQPYWGNCIDKLGVGPKPILRRQLNVERLSDAITGACNNPGMIAAADKLGQQLRREDGAENAVSIMERIVCK
ncbi:MAG TPA: glycosyltransferase [Clostridia bacterium]|nr:glycosyltransferase [Clostridia bacterium]